MENNTKIIETPVDKHKIEIKTWITGGDRRALRNVYLDVSRIEMKGDEPEIKGLTGNIVEQAENKAIEIAVVSIDGSKENILKRILDMHEDDYEIVMQNIEKITKEKKSPSVEAGKDIKKES